MASSQRMTIDDFREAILRWGADVDRWPAAEREAASAISATREGRELVAAEAAFDALLSRPPSISDDRAQRAASAVLRALALEDQKARAPTFIEVLREWLLPLAGVAGSAAFGVALAIGSHQLPAGAEVTPFQLILDTTSMLGVIETR